MLLGALVLAALCYGPVAALQWRTTQEDRYIEAVTQQADARRVRDAARRVNAAVGDRAAVADMREWGFEATNMAVAQVLIERRILKAAGEAGIPQLSIALDSEIEEVGPTKWLAADIQMGLSWRALFALLDNLAAWPEGFRIEGFNYEYTALPAAQQSPNYGYGAAAPIRSGTIRLRVAFPERLATEEVAS